MDHRGTRTAEAETSTAQPRCALDRGAQHLHRRDAGGDQAGRGEDRRQEGAHQRRRRPVQIGIIEGPACSKARVRSSPVPPAGSARAIAEALASAGANVMLNGFGDAGRDRTPARRARRVGQGRGRLSRRRHVEARGHPRHGRERAEDVRRRRHPGEQCRHPARRAGGAVPRRQLGRHHRHQPVLGLPRHQGRACPACARASGAASSTSPRPTAWSPRRRSRPTCRPSMGLSA